MVASRKTKFSEFLKKPVNQRITQRGPSRNIMSDYRDIRQVKKGAYFSVLNVADELGISEANVRKMIKEKEVTAQIQNGLISISREELLRIKNKDGLALSSAQAFEQFKRISRFGKEMSYEGFILLCKRMELFEVTGKGKRTELRMRLPKLLYLIKRYAELQKWTTPKSLAARIGMSERAFLYNLRAERGLLEQCVQIGVPGGYTIRIPPELEKTILDKQKDLTTEQARQYLKSHGVNFSYSGFMKLLEGRKDWNPGKKPLIRARKERGFDNSIRVTQEELDRYLNPKRVKAERIKPVPDYALEREHFIKHLAEKSFAGNTQNAERVFEMLVREYKQRFTTLPKNPDTIANVLNSAVGRKIPTYVIINDFANWLFVYKWEGIIKGQEKK